MAEFVEYRGQSALELDPDIETPLLEAYYTELVRSPITARETAQRAFTVVTAISGALVAGAALVNLPDRSDLVIGLGFSALIAWIIASLLFMQAMGSRAYVKTPEAAASSEWSALAVNESIASRNKLYAWLLGARWVTLVAAIVTLASVVAAIIDIRDRRAEQVVVRLTPNYQAQIKTICPGVVHGIRGAVERRSLQSRFLTVTADAGQCGAKRTKLRLRSVKVTSITP